MLQYTCQRQYVIGLHVITTAIISFLHPLAGARNLPAADF